MSTVTVPTFGVHNHPAGQIAVRPRRDVAARVSALGGYRVNLLPGRSAMTLSQTYAFTQMVES
ncbi:hypothetical protein [Kibdelosporangium aridum]|uniref:hypothetical protein n=1 Tax=Kibdelosporangium aridum TaxID=2030 RepID=UPI000527C717